MNSKKIIDIADAYSDEALIKSWPGFENKYAIVNGVELHYVEGGSGSPLLCLPGWPQTWYSFHAVGPQLAKKHRVIVVESGVWAHRVNLMVVMIKDNGEGYL